MAYSAQAITHIVLNHYEPEESAVACCPMFSDTTGSGHQYEVMGLEEFARRRGFDVDEVRRIIRENPRDAPQPLVWERRRPPQGELRRPLPASVAEFLQGQESLICREGGMDAAEHVGHVRCLAAFAVAIRLAQRVRGIQ